MSKAKSPAEKIESVNAQIEKAKEEIRQHQNRLKRLTQTAKAEERNARTRRLIERGAILEKQIEDAEKLTNEQIKLFLEMTLQTDEAREALAMVREQPADPAPEQPATTPERDGELTTVRPAGTAQDNNIDGGGNMGGGARQVG